MHLKKADILEYVPVETLISNSWIKALKHHLKYTQIDEEKISTKGTKKTTRAKFRISRKNRDLFKKNKQKFWYRKR